MKSHLPEAIGTFFLVFTVGLCVNEGLAMAKFTGGAFNPAVGLGPALAELVLGKAVSSAAWIYAVGPLVGAGAAGYV